MNKNILVIIIVALVLFWTAFVVVVITISDTKTSEKKQVEVLVNVDIEGVNITSSRLSKFTGEDAEIYIGGGDPEGESFHYLDYTDADGGLVQEIKLNDKTIVTIKRKEVK